MARVTPVEKIGVEEAAGVADEKVARAGVGLTGVAEVGEDFDLSLGRWRCCMRWRTTGQRARAQASMRSAGHVDFS